MMRYQVTLDESNNLRMLWQHEILGWFDTGQSHGGSNSKIGVLSGN
jgi:hypothetical protein